MRAPGKAAWIVALSAAAWLGGCVVRSGYSHRNASGGVVSAGMEGVQDHAAIGGQVGVAAHDEAPGTAVSVRGDLHVGISSIRDVRVMRTVEWAASVFVGFDRTSGEDYKDVTFPVGVGLTLIVPVGARGAVSVQPRYNFHLGDEAPRSRRHELMLSVGFHWAPAIDFMTD